MTTRTVPFADRHRPPAPASEAAREPDPAARLVQPDGRPARLKKTAVCPQCGAGADRRVRSGMGAMVSVTCENCGHDYEREPAV